MQAAMKREVAALEVVAPAPAPAEDFEEQSKREQSALGSNQHLRTNS